MDERNPGVGYQLPTEGEVEDRIAAIDFDINKGVRNLQVAASNVEEIPAEYFQED